MPSNVRLFLEQINRSYYEFKGDDREIGGIGYYLYKSGQMFEPNFRPGTEQFEELVKVLNVEQGTACIEILAGNGRNPISLAYELEDVQFYSADINARSISHPWRLRLYQGVPGREVF